MMPWPHRHWDHEPCHAMAVGLHLAHQRPLVIPVMMQVAETNTAAAMYSRAGFHVAKRTRDDWTAPLMHLILHSFLGYGSWHRMVKVSLLRFVSIRQQITAFPEPGCMLFF